MIPVRFSNASKRDLNEIADYIGRDNPKRAVTFTRELVSLCKNLGQTPHIGSLRSAFGDRIRMLPYGNYNIYYRTLDTHVNIERVFHSARIIGLEQFN